MARGRRERGRRGYGALLTATVALLAVAPAQAVRRGDFNGDGRVDLAIGVPNDDVFFISNQEDAGAVNVLPGAKGGIDAALDTYLTQATSNNIPADFESFGDDLAAGDFDGDGHSDLAVGVPFDDPGGVQDGGSVNIFYGTDTGVTGTDAQLFSQDTAGVPDQAESADWFGIEVASGDFDGDGFDDLAVDAVQDDIASNNFTDGDAIVLYGGMSGLSSAGSQLWSQDTAGLIGEIQGGERFGGSLAAGDFDGDDHDDLALGSVTEDADGGAVNSAGAVNVIFGSDAGLATAGNEFLQQGEGKIDDKAEAEDKFSGFGNGLAAGDANRDGRDDLAVGVTGENGGLDGRGAVHFFRGSPKGLVPAHDRVLSQATKGVPGKAKKGDTFGSSVVFGDFTGDKRDDVAVGVRGEKLPHAAFAGAVNVFLGSKKGLSTKGARLWSQATGGVLGKPQKFDVFGASLGSGDFDGKHGTDLAIGVPNDKTFGAVSVLYSRKGGLSSKGDDLFSQNSSGVSDDGEEGDQFGQSLAPP